MEKIRLFFRSLLRLIFPTNGQELGILLFFIISFGVLATDIALGYRIIFDQRIPWDGYFSFDNRSIVLTGGGSQLQHIKQLVEYITGMEKH